MNDAKTGSEMAMNDVPKDDSLSRRGWLRGRWPIRTIDVMSVIALAVATVVCAGYAAARGFHGGFVDMAHDGYQLRQALDLVAGQVIFRDTFDQYGPLTAYLNLFGFVTFGHRLLAIKYFLALWYGVTAVSMFVFARQFLGRTLSVLTVALAFRTRRRGQSEQRESRPAPLRVYGG